MVGRVDVRRVNVLTREGRQLAGRVQVDEVPMVLLFDGAGRERYRAHGFALRRDELQRWVARLERASADGGRAG